MMDQGLQKDKGNNWVAPLPFRTQRRRLPDNRAQALKRLTALRRNFDRKPEMRDHFISFMEEIFENDHAEVAPPLREEEERWIPTNLWRIPPEEAWTNPCGIRLQRAI